MDLPVALATFAVIFPAELPDKSMFAAVVMGSRFRPLPVWLGLASAFFVHVVLAVAAGGVIALLPHTIVESVVAVFFLAGACLLLFKTEEKEQLDGEQEGSVLPIDVKSNFRIFATAFGIIFVSEWGDLTQIATVNLAARYDDPVSVGIGATLALWSVTGLGVALGNRLVRAVPLGLVRRIAGIVLLGLGLLSIVDLLRS